MLDYIALQRHFYEGRSKRRAVVAMFGYNTSRLINLTFESRNESSNTTPRDVTLLYIATVEILITFAGCIGNSLTSLAILRNKRLQVAANFYVLTLSIADLLVCGVLVPMRAVQHIFIFKNNPFPQPAVDIIVFIGKATILVSIATLGALSVDRFIAMKYPFRYRAKIRNCTTLVLLVSLLIWFVSFSLPALSEIPGISSKDTLLIFVAFVVSMSVVIVVAYFNVYRIIKRQSAFRNDSSNVFRSQKENRVIQKTATTAILKKDRSQTTFTTEVIEHVRPGDLVNTNMGNNSQKETINEGKTNQGREKNATKVFGKSKTETGKRNVSQTSPLLECKDFESLRCRNQCTNNSKAKSRCSQNEKKQLAACGHKDIYDCQSFMNSSHRKLGRDETGTKIVSHHESVKTALKHVFSRRKIDPQLEKQRQIDRKISVTIALVIGLFMVLVFPRIILILYHVAAEETPSTVLLRLWLRILLYINSVLNPVLYAWRLKDFREEFKRLALDCGRIVTGKSIDRYAQFSHRLKRESSDRNS